MEHTVNIGAPETQRQLRRQIIFCFDPNSVAEPKVFLSAPAPAPAPESFIRYGTLKITFFDLSNRIKTVTIDKNFFSNHDFFSIKSMVNRKEPEPKQFVISAPAAGGNLISAPGSGSATQDSTLN
jgi:hypothetical protein